MATSSRTSARAASYGQPLGIALPHFDAARKVPCSRSRRSCICSRFAVAALGVELGVDDRKELYRLIAAALAQRTPPKIIKLGAYFEVSLASAVHDLEGRLEPFAK